MEFQDLIIKRRSVREYAAGASHDDIVKIVRAAQMAPSWKNSQTARCYILEQPDQSFRETVLPSFNQNSSANASLIVTTFVKNVAGYSQGQPDNEIGNQWGAYDLGLHDAYLVLAAEDAGYDTLIMGIRDSAVIRKKLDIPENEEIMSVIALGRRAGEPAIRPRKELEEIAKFC